MSNTGSKRLNINSSSAEETEHQGFLLGKRVKHGSVVALFGDLGAGKTTFVKGFVQGASSHTVNDVTSPTFTYLQIYPPVYHFDLYRLRSESDFLGMGFDEYFSPDNICCIEWSEKIPSLLPQHTIRVHLTHAGEDKRLIEIEGPWEN
ncbi:MAG: tRNA (adenosine(37)-N6)-threonylcarbamoyltransferase complex ATPase subunit type 1 TsaE [Verrucomicrobia bacterium]|nr:tRNA (adenosine(37)-N6)-threonylcarbamoyltransferase complex ATPase subunit type 1 TsaE [Verrucomicrobiota bacterium]